MTQPSSTRETSKGMTDTIDPAVTHLSEAERITRLETEFKYLAKESSVVAVRNDIEKLQTALTSQGDGLRKETSDQGNSLKEAMATQEKLIESKFEAQDASMRAALAETVGELRNEINAARNWILVGLLGAVMTSVMAAIMASLFGS